MTWAVASDEARPAANAIGARASGPLPARRRGETRVPRDECSFRERRSLCPHGATSPPIGQSLRPRRGAQYLALLAPGSKGMRVAQRGLKLPGVGPKFFGTSTVGSVRRTGTGSHDCGTADPRRDSFTEFSRRRRLMRSASRDMARRFGLNPPASRLGAIDGRRGGGRGLAPFRTRDRPASGIASRQGDAPGQWHSTAGPRCGPCGPGPRVRPALRAARRQPVRSPAIGTLPAATRCDGSPVRPEPPRLR